MTNILLTGSSGFVGKALLARWSYVKNVTVRSVYRKAIISPHISGNITPVLSSLTPSTDWGSHLAGIDCVVHCAGITPVRNPLSSQHRPDVFQYFNVDTTLNLARQAAFFGVRRFIYLSSFSLYGKESDLPLSITSPLNPIGPYALSKLNAELGLQHISSSSELNISCIRVPLVIGTGSFNALSQLVKTRIPLPVGGIDNLRTIIGIDTLVRLIDYSVTSEQDLPAIILAGDLPSLSTADLVTSISRSLGISDRPILLPYQIGKSASRFMYPSLSSSLYGSLYVNEKSVNLLPGLSLDTDTHRSIAMHLNGLSTGDFS